MSASYLVHSSWYLSRARSALDRQEPESLFYAAFELRCGIEARLREYLEERENVSKRKREGWRIAILSAGLEEAFGSSANKEARLTFHDQKGIFLTLSYKPVTPRLQNAAERLGDYLHAQREERTSNDPWWATTRAFLERTYRELEWSVAGDLLCVPLIDAQGQLSVEALMRTEDRLQFAKILRTSVRMNIEVEYLEPPAFL